MGKKKQPLTDSDAHMVPYPDSAHPGAWMEFGIYCLCVNRKDLLEGAIRSLGKYAARLTVIDNSPAEDLDLTDSPCAPGAIYRPPVPLFVSQSYNLALKLAVERKQAAFFVLHSDAEASPEIVEAMLARANELEKTRSNWGVMLSNYDVLVLYRTGIIREFPWDTFLPAYYTDVDHTYRLKLAGVKIVETGLPVVHRNGGSSAMKADRHIQEWVTTNYPAWRQYYLRKWGGERNEERFVTPFGE